MADLELAVVVLRHSHCIRALAVLLLVMMMYWSGAHRELDRPRPRWPEAFPLPPAGLERQLDGAIV